ncbi:MAG TPA: exodeoxyribonuclease VII small subunit [Peptococcaceae bacterium]|jgi:exodeoxyribonuclease VII small subunit|nr:exodeoxyribonuclease VII small subunit [Clostridia bacterium]HOB81509.1 exodeoxyribonuclease VII small subunit [Peptococcaceae bacterium]HPZ71663.1 exodeoxyribonuclease VII small subunit [Peptococcaceae bacterium]HQD53597.1 exodeoxyribonuclease VII small subunit [Peptococcaceae bacterium]
MPQVDKEHKDSYEASIKKLEEIIARLEKGEITLEQGLSYFEEGIALIRKCQSLLDRAAEKVQVLQEGELAELADFKPENGVK